MRDLTPQERTVAELLGECAIKAAALPELHSSDMPEFCHAIHMCQNIIYARPAFEAERAKWGIE
jgi:hypothetical protein